MSLFSPDSKFMQFMSRVGDLLLLNFYFLITCIPLVTIGSAVTAMYTVCFRFGSDQEPVGVTRTYFKAFRENLKPATLIWLLLLLLGAATAFNTLLFFSMIGAMRYVCVLFGTLFLLVLFMAAYAFPLVSLFENGVIPTLKNALVMSLAYLPRTILVVALNIFPFVLLLFRTYDFFSQGLLWVLIYFAAAAYANAWLLRKVVAPYLEDGEEQDVQSRDE